MGRILAIFFAVLLHVGIILFGGLLFLRDKEDKSKLQQVELLGGDEVAAAKEKKKPEEQPAEKKDEIRSDEEKPPDSAELLHDLELNAANDAPALEAASLSAIEAALSGQGGAGDFAEALSFSSGGRIGGMGKAGSLDEKLENAFSLAEIDQKPRAIYQSQPVYPVEMRGKKIEAVVTVVFVVESTGRVSNPRVEKSTHPAFEKPALDAVKQWKFDPGIRGGQRVSCKMRESIRFPPS